MAGSLLGAIRELLGIKEKPKKDDWSDKDQQAFTLYQKPYAKLDDRGKRLVDSLVDTERLTREAREDSFRRRNELNEFSAKFEKSLLSSGYDPKGLKNKRVNPAKRPNPRSQKWGY